MIVSALERGIQLRCHAVGRERLGKIAILLKSRSEGIIDDRTVAIELQRLTIGINGPRQIAARLQPLPQFQQIVHRRYRRYPSL